MRIHLIVASLTLAGCMASEGDSVDESDDESSDVAGSAVTYDCKLNATFDDPVTGESRRSTGESLGFIELSRDPALHVELEDVEDQGNTSWKVELTAGTTEPLPADEPFPIAITVSYNVEGQPNLPRSELAFSAVLGELISGSGWLKMPGEPPVQQTFKISLVCFDHQK